MSGFLVLRLVIGSVFLILLPVHPMITHAGDVSESIRERITALQSSGSARIEAADIAAVDVISRLYRSNGWQPYWADPDAVQHLLTAVKAVEEDGLKPSDYHAESIAAGVARSLQKRDPTSRELADLDIVSCDSFIRLAYSLYFGKVDPEFLNPHNNFTRKIGDEDPVSILREALESGGVESFLEGLKPSIAYYSRLKKGLALYRTIQDRGGWEKIPEGPTLSKGSRGPRVALLKKRLALTDPVPGGGDDPELFDASLERAVRNFQTRRNMGANGVVGRTDLLELNEPVESSIDQIRANLERARWVFHDLPGSFVLVDIAGYRLIFVRDRKRAWETRIQVGDPYSETQVFKADMRSIEFNPTWTVPPSILREDLLPQIKENPELLKDHNIDILDKNGSIVSAKSIDWKRATARNFPYRLRQHPGPSNPLGHVKFVMPNRHFIILHDTIERDAFGEEWRALSAGCVRVEDPLKLAELLLNDSKNRSRRRLEQIVEEGKTRAVALRRPVPVLLLYMTTDVDDESNVHFREDLYGRDNAVLEGLAEPFRFHRRS